MDKAYRILLSDPSMSKRFRITLGGVRAGVELPAYGQLVVNDDIALELGPDARGYYSALIESEADRMFLRGKVFSKVDARKAIKSVPSLTSALTEDAIRALIDEIDASPLPETFHIDAVKKILEEFRKPRLVRVSHESHVGVEVWVGGQKVMLEDDQRDRAMDGVSFSRARAIVKLAIILDNDTIDEGAFSRMMHELESSEAFAALPMVTPPKVVDMIMRAREAMLEDEGAMPSLQDLLGVFGMTGNPSGFSGRPPEDDFGRLFSLDELRPGFNGMCAKGNRPDAETCIDVTFVRVCQEG